MRIGIDATTWSNRRGYGRFIRGLITRMVTDYPEHEFVLVTDQHTAEESRFPAGAEVKVVNTSQQPSQAASADGARRPLDLLRMGWAVSRLPLDVFFFPTRYSFFPLFGRTPTVVAFHDATAERHPDLIFSGRRSRLFWKMKTWAALKRAARLVTVSADARVQIAATFGLEESEISVITEGPDPVFRRMDRDPDVADVRARYGLPPDTALILYVGGISPHKNLQGLLHALKLIEQAPCGPWHAVLVGDYQKDSFLSSYHEISALAVSLDLADRITFTGYVPDEDLALLYNTATMLVLPSMSEGFGLPVVEAMASGLPVAASNRNSLPEVLGSSGLLFDPETTTEIADAIRRLLSDEELRRQFQERGLERAKLFSWQGGAATMMGILTDAAGRRSAAVPGDADTL